MKLIKEVNTQGYFSWQNGLQLYSADEICDLIQREFKTTHTALCNKK